MADRTSSMPQGRARGTARRLRWPRRSRAIGWVLALAVLLAGAGTPVLAQPTIDGATQGEGAQGTTQGSPVQGGETPNVVIDIVVEGNVHVGRGEVLSTVGSRVGAPLVMSQVSQDIKDLYALGFFEQVRAEAEPVPGEGYTLVFAVEEKPRIASVQVTGANRLDRKDLLDKLPLKAGSFFTRARLDDDVEAIRSQYRAEGYLKVDVEPRLIPAGPKAYDLVLAVEESPRFYITDISIHGTTVFSELELLRKMRSAEVDCFDWINDSGVYDYQKINQDLQLIVTEYLQLGYIRVFIPKPKITLVRNREFTRIIVDITVEEGAQYFTGTVDVAGDILGERDDLLDAVQLTPGDPYNPLLQNQDRFRLNQIYQEQGYAFVQVRPQPKIDDERHIVDVVFDISKGEKAYIGRIVFQGNRETRDFVLRREFEVRENELYNGRKLRESQQNLMALGYFKPSLQVNTQPREVDNVLDVVTKVEETQTGTLQAQIGYSDQSGATVSASVSKGNFLGRGQTLRFSAQWAQKNVTRDVSTDFIEPHLLGSEYSSESSLAYRNIEDQSELDRGIITEIQGTQGFGRPIIGPLRVNLSLSLTNRTFEDPDTDPVKLRTFTTALVYNTVNHPVFPSAGTQATLAVSQIGGQVLGGTTEYRRYRLRVQKFYALNESATLIAMGRARIGYLEAVGDNEIPREDRFRLGGISTVRGFEFNEIGGPFGTRQQGLNAVDQLLLDERGEPVLDADGQPVFTAVDQRILGLNDDQRDELRGGGIFERLFNLELLFPLAGDNVRGVVFYDAGQVNAESRQYDLLGEQKPGFFDLLQSYGAGVRLITPLGVFRFEYGAKLNPEPGESPDKFDFTISTLF